MFFKRIVFSFFVSKKTAILLKYHLSSPRVPGLEKKLITEAQPTLGVVALFLTLQESLFPVRSLSPEHGSNVKTFPHNAYGEKGKQTETGTKESAAMGRMRMFALQGQHKAQE